MTAAIRVPIITYHSIDDRGTILSTAPALFAAHVAALARGGWRTAGIAAIARALRKREALPARTIALTFDDGYANFAKHAWPALKSARLGATLFALGERAIASNTWDSGAGTLGGEPLLTGAALRELADEGVEIGAHSMTHARLTELAPAVLALEAGGSCRALAETIGRPVRVFAYPYGAQNAAVRDAIAACCDAACSTRMGFASASSDPFLLERIDAYYLRDVRLVESLDSAATRAYLRARAVLRRLRSAHG
ncbi:MAG: polysaccharide deacetylase family protein [bacterium]